MELVSIISIVALCIALSRWAWDIFLYFYQQTEDIKLHPESSYEIELDPKSRYNRGATLLLFKNFGRQMGFVILQEVRCPTLEPYLELSVFFQKEGPHGQHGLWDRWEDKIGSVDAQSGSWAHLTLETRGIPVKDEDGTFKETRYIELPPDLQTMVPLTLRYKVTRKDDFVEMEDNITFHIIIKEKSSSI